MELGLWEQINIFYSIITTLIDQGNSISIENLEAISSKKIVEFINKTFANDIRNINYDTENLKLVDKELSKIFISKQDAKEKYGINNNGLIYLQRILFDKLYNEVTDLTNTIKEEF